MHHTGFILDPAPYDATVDPSCGAGITSGVEELVAVRAEVEVTGSSTP